MSKIKSIKDYKKGEKLDIESAIQEVKEQKMEDNPHFLFIQNAYKWYRSLKESDVPNDISTLTILEEQHKLAILKAFKNKQNEK